VANIKQQKKRILVAKRQRLENLRYRSQIKTYFRRLSESVNGGDAEKVTSEHTTLVRLIDKAAARNALHANTAVQSEERGVEQLEFDEVDDSMKRMYAEECAKNGVKVDMD